MPAAPRRPPTRTCVACRTSRAKRELVRVVRTPAGSVEIDDSGRLAGRGAYLCRDGACWETALGKGALQRALGVPLPSDVRERLASGATNMKRTTTNTTDTTMTTGGASRGEE